MKPRISQHVQQAVVHGLVVVVEFVLLCVFGVAGTIASQLPPDIEMNKEAGRGGLLTVAVRLESGDEVPLVVDTGTPLTLFDQSLAPKLGKSLEEITFSSPGGKQRSGIYAAQKLFLNGVLLTNETYVATFDFRSLSRRADQKFMGILGMDCLRHYCIQLDFEAGKLRFLEAGQVKASELGKAFPLTFSNERQNFPPMFAEAKQNDSLPFISHAGLFGGTDTLALLDTGDNIDGAVKKGVIKGHYGTRFAHFLFKGRAMRLPKCVWSDETYTKLKVGSDHHPTRLGLRFFARHLVTFDFPNKTMYLKKVRAEPLPPKKKDTTAEPSDGKSTQTRRT